MVDKKFVLSLLKLSNCCLPPCCLLPCLPTTCCLRMRCERSSSECGPCANTKISTKFYTIESIPSNGKIGPTVINKVQPIESMGSRLPNHTRTFDSGVRTRSNSRRTLPLEGIAFRLDYITIIGRERAGTPWSNQGTVESNLNVPEILCVDIYYDDKIMNPIWSC